MSRAVRSAAFSSSLLLAAAAVTACGKASSAPAESAPVVAESAAPAKASGAPAAPHAEGKGFHVEVTSPVSASPGAPATARVTLRARDGYKVNKEFPLVLKVTPPAGVTVAKAQQKVQDAASFADHEATFDVRFTAADKGDKPFAATFRFAVCTDTTCDPKVVRLAWNVAVR